MCKDNKCKGGCDKKCALLETTTQKKPLDHATIQEAAKLIEKDGKDALITVDKMVGEDVASALFSAFCHLQKRSYECMPILRETIFIVEAEGETAYSDMVNMSDPDIAVAVLIMYLRHKYGAWETYPASPKIDARVFETLSTVCISV